MAISSLPPEAGPAAPRRPGAAPGLDGGPPTQPPSGSAMPAFAGRVLDDMAAAMAGFMCALGDRLGLFAALAAAGPATSAEFADRTGVDERYVRDWLGSLGSRGYLELDRPSGRYALGPEQAMVLAAEGTPLFMGGAFEQLTGVIGPLERVLCAAREGTGVPPDAYGPAMHRGMERISAAWFDHMLVPLWIPAVPDVAERLAAGADVADIGCGSGRALVALASAFEASRFVGVDLFEGVVERARANAAAAGVDGRLAFECRDAVDGLAGDYDLVTMFDVLHDIAQPVEVLRGVRRSLRPDGTLLLMEMRSADRREDNAGPIATMLYATSVLFCVPTSIATGGEGLGTLGLPEARVRELCAEAGFGSVDRLPIENPFNVLYAARP